MTRRASKTKQAVHGPDLTFFFCSNAVLKLRCTANIAAPFRSSPRITRLPARPLPLPLCWAHLARTTHDHVRRLSPSSVQVCSSLACRLHAPWAWLAANGRPRARSLAVPLGLGFFSFLYLKKLKFQKYMVVSKNFKIIPLSPLAWATGGLSSSGWATGPKCKKNYI